MKIVGVGFHKTGTTSLAHCLKCLGYTHASVAAEYFEWWLNSDHKKLPAYP